MCLCLQNGVLQHGVVGFTGRTVTDVTAAASVLIQLPREHVQTASVAAAPKKLGSFAVLPFFSQVELLIYTPRQKDRAQQRRNACEASPAETPRKF